MGSIIEVLWIHDDITEELDAEDAITEHEVLIEVLQLDIHPLNFKFKNIRQKSLAAFVQKAADSDPQAAPVMLEAVATYLRSYDHREGDFDNMTECMAYRVSNCGCWMTSFFIHWGMTTFLSDEEYESIREYELTMEIILGLTNDYFSWKIETDQRSDRVPNGVRILMKLNNIPAPVAKTMFLGIVVEQESRAVELREYRLQDRSRKPVSAAILRYIEAIELYVGRSCY